MDIVTGRTRWKSVPRGFDIYAKINTMCRSDYPPLDCTSQSASWRDPTDSHGLSDLERYARESNPSSRYAPKHQTNNHVDCGVLQRQKEDNIYLFAFKGSKHFHLDLETISSQRDTDSEETGEVPNTLPTALDAGKSKDPSTGQTNPSPCEKKIQTKLLASNDSKKKSRRRSQSVHVVDAPNKTTPNDPTGVWVWGENNHGELGIGEPLKGTSKCQHRPVQIKMPKGVAKLVRVALGSKHSVGLTARQEVYTCGAWAHGMLGIQKLSHDVNR